MKKNLTLLLALFMSLSLVVFAQDAVKDLDQTPTNFNNPETIYGSELQNPLAELDQSFEDPTFPPAGWVKHSPDGGTGWERQTVGTTPIPGWTGGVVTSPPGGGDGVAFCTWTTGGASANDQWLVSAQALDVQPGDSLKFWLRKFSNAYADNVDILISTTDQETGSFTITVDNIAYAATDTGWVQYSYNLIDHVSAGEDIYIAWREHVADNFNDGAAIFLDLVEVGGEQVEVTTIDEATEDLDGNYVPDHLGETFTVEGVVIGPNYQTSNTSYYIMDETGGTNVFYPGAVIDLNLGDLIQVTGEVAQYNGLTEIIPASELDIVLIQPNYPVPAPQLLTIEQYYADPEAYESELLAFVCLDKASGDWPAPGSSENLTMTNGTNDLVFRIDSDTDIDDNPEPTWPKDIIGIGSQFSFSDPPDDGYQIFPRYYDTDFLPCGTVPVELTSFTADVSGSSVTLNWVTASEINNQMFEVERKTDNNEFVRVGFVEGAGTTTEEQTYTFVDSDLNQGTYQYRLKQIDYDGNYAYTKVVEAEIEVPAEFALEQNYPNPFNPSTKIKFNLAVDSEVSLKIFNVLGQEVESLISEQLTAGVHNVNFNATNLNSGVYFYQLNAEGIDGSNFNAVKKMILTK